MRNRKTEFYKNVILKFFIPIILLLIFFTISFYYYKYYQKHKIITNIVNNIIAENPDIRIFNKVNFDELNGRIVLFNTYKMNDLSNFVSLDIAKKLQDKYKEMITIIDIITDETDFSKDTADNFIVKNDIQRPIFIIKNYTNKKHFIIANQQGVIEKIIPNTNFEDIEESIKELIKTRKNTINKLKIEKENLPITLIKSLSYIRYWNNYFIIVDSKGKSIFFIDKFGNIKNRINGFCYPSGITIKDNNLYIADTCDNAIKKINLETLELENYISVENPLAVAFSKDDLYISTTTQLLKEKEGEIATICGNCPNIFKLTKYNDKVYFSTDDHIKFLSSDLFINDFIQFDTNMNFLHIDETGIFIIDKFNNKIFRIKNNELKTYSESEKYNMPVDMIDYKDKLFITNENNKNILILDKATKEIQEMNLVFDRFFRDYEQNEEFLYNDDLDLIEVKDNTEIKLLFNLPENYTLESFAPQKLKIFEEKADTNEAILIKEYAKNDMRDGEIELIKFDTNKTYYIKGKFFYHKNNKPILEKEYIVKIISTTKSNKDTIYINFPSIKNYNNDDY
ncbi:MAG: hypothetical protein Ta2D_12900 [Rickettsiales bacterium]|nr:MAG: hypothetical protein Ta2D_12900 [Rickettsiales bacterium]